MLRSELKVSLLIKKKDLEYKNRWRKHVLRMENDYTKDRIFDIDMYYDWESVENARTALVKI